MSLSPEISTPTADAGTTDAGTAPEATETTAPSQTTSAPAQPQTRTYSQADMDKAAAWYRKSLREETERVQREYQTRTQPSAAEQIDPVTQDLQSLKFQMTEFQLDRAINDLGKRYPELTHDAQLREVLEVVVDRGLDRVTHLSIPDVLDLAYRYWKADRAQPPVDIEAIKRQAEAEASAKYLAKKVTTASTTPPAAGAGGGTPATTDTRAARRSKKGAFDAAIEYVTKQKALGQ